MNWEQFVLPFKKTNPRQCSQLGSCLEYLHWEIRHYTCKLCVTYGVLLIELGCAFVNYEVNYEESVRINDFMKLKL